MTSAGIQYASWYARDPFRLGKIEAVVLPYSKVNWDTFQTPAPNVVDQVAPVLGARVKAMFEQLVNVININGRFTPNQLLTAIGDFTAYLDFYTNAFSEIWAALCVIKAMDLNSSFRAMGAGVAGGGNLDRIATAWRRLQLVPVPPEFPKLLSKIMGVIYSEPEDFAYITYSDPNATAALVTDWTLATGAGSVAALLTTAEGQLATLETSGAEVSIIQELMSVVYGDPAPLPEPFVNSNQVAFDMHFTRESVFLVATFFAQPSLQPAGGAGGTIPVLIRKGYEKDEMTDLMFTFLRPQIYDASGLTGTLGATHSSVGLLTQADNQAGYSRVYGPLPGNNTIFQDTSFAALNFGNNTFVEIEFWAEFVQSTSGTLNWQTDSRSYDPWTSFYPNPAALGSNTEAWINRLFFTGMKIKELR